MRLVLVVPCYDEERRLDRAAFVDFEAPAGYSVEFLFVNDGSTDDTLTVLRSLAEARPDVIHVLDQQPNKGKAESVRFGLLRAFERQPDLVGFWDADLATPLCLIPGYLEILQARPSIEMVFGSRVKLLGRTIERRTWRHYLGRGFATCVSMMLDLPIYDSQCGAKIFRATPMLAGILEDPFASPWLFDVEILARAQQALAGTGRQLEDLVYELPLQTWRDVPGSKLTGASYIRAASSLARIYWVYRHRRLRIAAPD